MEEQKLLKRKQKALTEGNKTLLHAVCTDLAEIYMNQCQYKKAIAEYKQLAQICKEKGNDMDYGRANRGIGEAYIMLRDFNKAVEHQHIYLEIARKEKNEIEEQRALANIGHTYLTRYLDEIETPQKPYLNSAYKYFMKSLVACENLKSISKFERADMSSRIFSNLGLVHESLGNIDKAVELFTKSINICKTHDIFEQLHRSYMSLASLYEKKEEYNNAIKYYNLAIEAAKTLKNKNSFICTALSSKAEALVKLGDFPAAKAPLYKAYKLKGISEDDKAVVEHNLKVVVAICQAQKKLLTTPDSCYEDLKKLYERMGDGACELKNYTKAIEYYIKMLEAAKKCDIDERTLATCYFSLAETYRDNKQYAEAIEYYTKEYEMCKDLKDSLNTLRKIAECTEANGNSMADVKAVFDKGIKACREAGDSKEESRLLVQYINFLRRSGLNNDAFVLEQRQSKLGYVSSDTESEDVESQASAGTWGDVSLGNITDISDNSDAEDPEPQKTTRRRTKNYVLKRNNKGETPLHTACIAGNLNMVKQLLDQGHPVNVRDHCGWLPLHEACICGHLEIVKLLLEKGASINDRGGTLCNGVTPLHDAASNGHLDVIEYLISKGASLVSKTDDGDTVLSFLYQWRSTVDLQSDELAKYQNIVRTITHAIEKSGQKISTTLKRDTSSSTQSRVGNQYVDPSQNSRVGNLRRTVHDTSRRISSPSKSSKRSRNSFSSRSGSESENSSNSDCNSEPEETAATNAYRSVMDELRHKPQNTQRHNDSSLQKRPALIGTDEFVDDWLIDDMQQYKSNKRRKTSDTQVKTISRQNSFEKDSSNTVKANSRESLSRTPVFVETSPIKTLDSPSFVDLTSNLSSNSRKKTTNTQISLLQSGFSRDKSRSPLKTSNTSNTINERPKKTQQTKLTTFGHVRCIAEPDSTTRSPMKRNSSSTMEVSENVPCPTSYTAPVENLLSIDPTLSVDVRIEGRLFRVPVLMSQIHSRTIKWLAEEAATRYAKKEFMKPILELETTNGAVLADEDLVSLLFTAGSTHAEEVHARVLDWNIPAVSERYKESCSQLNLEPIPLLVEKLQGLSIELDLADRALRGTALVPLLKALNRQTNLLELRLAGNFLSIENMRLLGVSLSTLKNLNLLDLSCTGIRTEHIQTFANTIASNNESYPNLHHLDLSYNFLGNTGLKHLEIITNQFNLRILKLADVSFTSELFNCASNSNVNLNLKSLEHLNLSDNSLNASTMAVFFTYLDSQKLRVLDVSRNKSDKDILKEIVFFLSSSDEGARNLETLNLSRCDAQDGDIFDLLRAAGRTLKNLNLSYCSDLTGISLRRLLTNFTLTHLNLSGCKSILKYFESSLVSHLDVNKQLISLKISVDSEQNPIEHRTLDLLWKNLHGENAIVASMPHFLMLSVKT